MGIDSNTNNNVLNIENNCKKIDNSVGLGVTISKRLVELIGGKFSIEEKAFWKNKTILIIDDDKTMIQTAYYSLINCGADESNIVIGYDGKDAIEAAKKIFFDIILMDIMMPNVFGFDAMMQIREQNNHIESLIIACTGYNPNKQNKEEFYKTIGFDGYIQKPVNDTKLNSYILNILENKNKSTIDKDFMKNLKILIVDEKKDNIDIVKNALTKQGVLNIAYFGTEADAIKNIKNGEKYDILLMDENIINEKQTAKEIHNITQNGVSILVYNMGEKPKIEDNNKQPSNMFVTKSFDSTKLTDLFSNIGKKGFIKVLDAFFETLNKMDLGVTNDHQQLKQVSHKLKSSSNTLGATKLYDICISIEKAIGKNDLGLIPLLSESFKNEISLVKNDIDQIIKTANS